VSLLPQLVSSEEKIKMSISMCGNFQYGVVC